jgi:hypothetical protein
MTPNPSRPITARSRANPVSRQDAVAYGRLVRSLAGDKAIDSLCVNRQARRSLGQRGGRVQYLTKRRAL